MSSTDDGMPFFHVGGGAPRVLRAKIAEARTIVEPSERAARLYFLGRGLLDCDDETTAEEAVAVLHDAMELGSTHAAFDLATLALHRAEVSRDLAIAMALLQRAANGGHEEAAAALSGILTESTTIRTPS